jgi:nucleoside-diphosphate-sugar epimerase
MILITGAEGLIGRHLSAKLEASGLDVRGFDLRHSPTEDICNRQSLAAALEDVSGVIHLAAVSRVVWAERDPPLCARTNIGALTTLVDLCVRGAKPWLIFASSREVYGQADRFPVGEDAEQRPMNTYARSKRDGELIVQAAIQSGLSANICRFSNVFGCPHDYPDRVAMAFSIAAARGGTICVEGSGNTFDFTFIDDVVGGLWQLVQATIDGERLPPIHFVSGRGTTLGELAGIAATAALAKVTIEEASPRTFDVSAFVGDPKRAERLLGWKARSNLEARMSELIATLAGSRGYSRAQLLAGEIR